jgi:hypothetical protein
MSATVGAVPEELDEYVRASRTIIEREREVLRRVERALDGLGAARRELGPAGERPTRSLRTAVARADALALEVASVATAFWAADQVLGRLAGAGTTSSGTTSSGTTSSGTGAGGRGTILPAPDVSIEWSWPPDWTIEGRWGDRRGYVEVEAGVGARAEVGAGADVTRDSIRLGTFADGRVGAWAIAGIGSAIGPFAAHAQGELFAGARTRAEAVLHIGRDGARAHVGGEVFAGVKAEGDLRGGFGPVQAGAHGGVSYGIGYTADADIDLSLDRIGGRVSLGGTLGLGFDGGLEYYIEPKWLADGVMQIGDGALDVGTRALDTGLDVGRGALDTGLDAGGEVVGAVGGWFR